MTASILIYAREAGGADCLLPVARLLAEEQVRITAWLEQPALDAFTNAGIESSLLPSDIATSVARLAPDVLLTSASSSSKQLPHDRALWRIAAKRGIPSMAVVDQWQNHEDRFLDRENGQLVFPDVIAVPDEASKNVVAGLARGTARVIVTGRPGLETEIGKIKPAGFAVRPFRVLFVSEPLHRYLRDTLRYDEVDVLKMLVEQLTAVFGGDAIVHVRPHPANTTADVEAMLQIPAPFPLKLDDGDPGQFHVVVGMRSVYLLKSILAGVLTLSVQPSGPGAEQCVATDMDLIPRIVDGETLRSTLMTLTENASARHAYLRSQSSFAPAQQAGRAVADACLALLDRAPHGVTHG